MNQVVLLSCTPGTVLRYDPKGPDFVVYNPPPTIRGHWEKRSAFLLLRRADAYGRSREESVNRRMFLVSEARPVTASVFDRPLEHIMATACAREAGLTVRFMLSADHDVSVAARREFRARLLALGYKAGTVSRLLVRIRKALQ